MKTLLIALTFILINIFAYSQFKYDGNLVLIDGFIYGNKIDNTVKSNNNIYKPGSVFTFDYSYIDKNGNELFFIINEYGMWDFVEKNHSEGNIIKDFKLIILDHNMYFKKPSYYQTGISYIINKNNLNPAKTGVIENENNIWLHPPREKLFKILQLNPYPYVKFPLEVGNTWNWKLQIGSGWGDKRWKEWSGIIVNEFHYRVVDKINVKTKIGTLVCYVIESNGISELGTTRLISYFNEKYGFVKFEYTNIDNSKLEIVISKLQLPSILKFKNSL